jgi:hypothetical protein
MEQGKCKTSKFQPRRNTMDYRNLFGMAAIILSCAVFIQSLNSANAFPQGPNVSMGSNPLDYNYQNCNSNSNGYTNNSTLDFIITDIIAWNDLHIYVDNAEIAIHHQGTSSLQSGIRIQSGETVTCSGGYLTIIGYYAHT